MSTWPLCVMVCLGSFSGRSTFGGVTRLDLGAACFLAWSAASCFLFSALLSLLVVPPALVWAPICITAGFPPMHVTFFNTRTVSFLSWSVPVRTCLTRASTASRAVSMIILRNCGFFPYWCTVAGWRQKSNVGCASPALSCSCLKGPREYGSCQLTPFASLVWEGLPISSEVQTLMNTLPLSWSWSGLPSSRLTLMQNAASG
mmetsp:Transcript_19903/g.36953  ORF Transcript_19903/g.36953 Transcript_19903/m.36953 type:complete len:202 (-) Transcript_19903:446-1051(-)